MNYYLDTEFNEKKGSIQLISIGIENDKGDTYYAISSEFKDEDCNDWVKANVLPKLKDMPRFSLEKIKEDILGFVVNTEEDKPVFWGYYADYDWVVFCWLFGTMMDLPKGYPMYCRDLKQEMVHLGLPKKLIPTQTEEHNALQDAKWNQRLHRALCVWEGQRNDEKIRHCDILFEELQMAIKSYEIQYNKINPNHDNIELILKLQERLKVLDEDQGAAKADKKGIIRRPKHKEYTCKHVLMLVKKVNGIGTVMACKEFKFRNENEIADKDYWLTVLCREMLYDIVGASVAFVQMNEDLKKLRA